MDDDKSVMATLRQIIASNFEFDQYYIDQNAPSGWVRANDMECYGDLDLVAGGGNKLAIFEIMIVLAARPALSL